MVPFSIIAQTSSYLGLINNARRFNAEKELNDMLALDILIGNNDRHLGNIQVMFDNDTFEVQGMSPIFDNGQGLCNRVPEITFEALKECFFKRSPALYDSFDDYFMSIVSEEFYNKLINLKDFEFTGCEFISSEDLSVYNKFIQWRIQDMIEMYNNNGERVNTDDIID
jgi:hypothetical protein